MKKRFLLTSVLMLLLTVMALSTATYAWFSMSYTNKVNDFTLTTVSAAGGLEISLDGTSWSSSDVTIANPSLKALDVTTNDGKTFYKLVNNDPKAALTGATPNTDYFEFKLYFRTTSAGEIKLNVNNSYILPADYIDLVHPADEVTPAEASNSDTFITKALAAYQATDNKSNGGDFSRDWIASAARISFELTGYQVAVDDKYSDSNDTEVSTDTAKVFDSLRAAQLKLDTVSGNYSIVKNATPTLDKVFEVQAADKKLSTTEQVAAPNAELFTGSGTDVTIVDIVQNGTGVEIPWEENKTVIAELTCRLWIEGQDAEAKLPLTSGLFTTALSFSLEQGDMETDPRKAIALSAFTPSADGFRWSKVDAGITGYTLYESTAEYTSLADLEDHIYDETDNPDGDVKQLNDTTINGTSDSYSAKKPADGKYYYLVGALDNTPVGGTGIYKDHYSYYVAGTPDAQKDVIRFVMAYSQYNEN